MPVTDAQISGITACLDFGNTRCCVPFPGGATLCPTGLELDALRLLAPYMAIINAACIPLMPIFRIIAVLLAIVECIKAVPQVVFNPGKVIECLIALGKAIIEVIKLIPQISLPFMIVGIFDCIRLFLHAIRDSLLRLLVKYTQLQIALQSPDLNIQLFAQCELKLVLADLANMNSLMAVVGTLFGVLNLFLGLLALPTLPTTISIGTDPSAAVAPLDVVIDTLDTVRAFIPIPVTAS